MAESADLEQPENWQEIGKQQALGIIEALAKANIGDSFSAFAVDVVGKVLALGFKLVVPIGVGLAKGISQAEDAIGPQMQEIAAAAASDVFGANIPSSAFGKGKGPGGNKNLTEALGAGFLNTVKGAGGTIEPGEQGAHRFLGLVLNMALEGWYQGWTFELLSSLVPIGDVGKIESFAELDDTLAQALGLGRLSRRVIGPIVDATCVVPLEWQTNKTYRHTMLPTAEILKAFLRGDYSGTEAAEELSRAGYSERRQEILLKSALKNISTDDCLTLVRHGVLDRGIALEKLRWQGYDQGEAELALLAAENRRIDAITDNSLSSLVRAYVNRDLTDSEFRTFLPAIITDPVERDTFETAARIQKDLNVQSLTHGEVIDCVQLEILPMAYYRDWLERAGYRGEEAAALEIRLRMRMDATRKVEEERARVLKERADAAKAKADADAARQLAIERERALARRGPLSELMRASVRGLIPIARVVEVLTEQYDPDTVAIYIADLEQQRAEYVAQQEAAEKARNRAVVRHIDVGALEQAVLTRVLTLDQFRRQLDVLHFTPADADLLTATLAAQILDRDLAEKKRREADAAAKIRSIDLGRLELLVRRGVRTFKDYDALLRSLGFDEPSRASMAALLQLLIDDDTARRKEREKVKPTLPDKGLSLEQFRRGVLLQLRTIDDFDAFLTRERYTADAHALLVAELLVDLAEADAARRRREQPPRELDPRALPLATVARAARLGIVPPALYQQRLEAFGYDDDDVAIEMALLIREIEEIQAGRKVATPLEAETTPAGLTLAQLAAAVRAGVQPLEAYQAALFGHGLSDGDIATLVRVLADELAATTAAKARRDAIGSSVKPAGVSLGVLEQQVRAGELGIPDYAAALQSAGVDAVDVALLVGLLVEDIS